TLTIQGSNTIGAKLAPALVSSYLKSIGAEGVEFTSNVENESQITAKMSANHSRGNNDVVIDIAAHGSSTGFKALKLGSADIAAASRPAKKKEIEQLSQMTELTSRGSEHIIGIDGLAIIVHPDNQLTEMDVQQIADIYSGKVSNWSELGGHEGAITLYARDNKSGTWDSFKRMVLGKSTLDMSALRFESNDELSDSVSKDRNAIGFVGLPSVRQSKLLAISDGDGKALKPNQLTIGTEDYALSRRLYFYTDDNPENKHVMPFMQFVQSVEGQKIVSENGFIAQYLHVVKPTNFSDLPLGFQLLAGEGQRLTVNFRFKKGSAKLDNRALQDIERLVDFSKQNPDQKLILIGFGDPKKSKDRSQLLSKLRAMAVRRELVKQGVYPKHNYGYGEQLPVASNDREAGRVKNRRVEVWLSTVR
ncbi:MAG TPA: hypothetical protein DIC30_08695, partial [Oceanospirillales bacterium]|nr:hypothetical protein [Oceanospirillales bacterium]